MSQAKDKDGGTAAITAPDDALQAIGRLAWHMRANAELARLWSDDIARHMVNLGCPSVIAHKGAREFMRAAFGVERKESK